MHITWIQSIRSFCRKHQAILLSVAILSLLYVLIGHTFFISSLQLRTFLLRLSAFVILYCCILLLNRRLRRADTRITRLVRRFVVAVLLLLSPVILLITCIDGKTDNGWDVRCQVRVPYKRTDIAVWFYGAGATDANTLVVQQEKQLLPCLFYVRSLYREDGDSLVISVKKDTVYIKNPYARNQLDRKVDLLSGTLTDNNVPAVGSP